MEIRASALGWLAASVLAAAACSGGGHGAATPAASRTATPAPTEPASSTLTAAPAPASPATVPGGTPTPSPQARTLRRGDASRHTVALTFDAGSDAGNTRAILATLRAQRVRATFCVTGLWAEANAGLLLSIAAEGHQLCNHTYDHASFTGASTGTPPLTAEERALELSRTETTVYRITGRTTRPYMRPPYGDIDAATPRDVADAGYSVIAMWTVDTLGWRGADADAIVERSLALAEPGAIYIMHVGAASQDAAALAGVIEGLRAAGYAFVALDDIG